MLEHLEFVPFNAGHILHARGDRLRSACFWNTGFVSLLTVFSNGKTVEGGLIGRDGFVELPLIVGFGTAATRAVVLTDCHSVPA
jgi:hypothetical protein